MSSSTRSVIDPDVLAKLGHLPLFARGAMVGSVAGKHRSPHRGSSMEFAEYRKYVPGDDTRRLDWRAYARSDRFFIKEFEADTNLRLILVLDISGSMGVAAADGGTTKVDYGCRMAATLAHLAVKQGDAVGLSLASEDLSLEIKPKRNASHLTLINQTLRGLVTAGPTGLVQVLHDVAEKNRQRALVIVFSDLFIDSAELDKALQHLRYRHHEVVAFQLMEQRELTFDFKGSIRFVDLEGGAPVTANPRDLGQHYLAALRRHMESLDKAARSANVELHRTAIDTPFEDTLAKFLLGRLGKKGSS